MAVIERKKYKLSARSIEQLKEFNELIKQGNVLQAVLGIAPFAMLLSSGASVTTPVEIATTDWEAFSKATKGAAIFVKNELKKFCEFEMLKQNNSPDDRAFWTQMKNSIQ